MQRNGMEETALISILYLIKYRICERPYLARRFYLGGTMYKLIGLLKRPEGISLEDFHRWWLNEHTTYVKRFPGLKRYVVNLTTTADQLFDGMAEVWFETKEDLER